MFEELLALKAEAENEILYAKAKLEVVEKLLTKFPVETEHKLVENELTDDMDEVDYSVSEGE